ncbi:MAG: MJ0042-type zinc finger domain-containing protein, partial [Burkholderiales bacterium]
MALATTCPQCKTSFKVVPDQLKLRRGLVRCGVCQHVFSGIDHLRYVDDAARAAQRAARERAASPGDAAGTPLTVGSSGSGTPGPAQGDANAARAAA